MFEVTAYLAVGFIGGIVMLKWPGFRSEEPMGTLFMMTIAWPMFALIGALVLASDFGTWLLGLVGIEAHHSDNHGV